jgi:hypothetical protein
MVVTVATALFGASLLVVGPVHSTWRWTRSLQAAMRRGA